MNWSTNKRTTHHYFWFTKSKISYTCTIKSIQLKKNFHYKSTMNVLIGSDEILDYVLKNLIQDAPEHISYMKFK